MQGFKIILVCLLGFIGCCNGQQQNSQNGASNSELILQSILDPSKGLFRPNIFDEARRLCPINLSEGSVHDIDFLAHCESRIIFPSFRNDSILKDLCDARGTWTDCGNHITPEANQCFDSKNDTRNASYSWKFTEGFTSYFCRKQQYFMEYLLDKEYNGKRLLICSSNSRTIGSEITTCLAVLGHEHDKSNQRNHMNTTFNTDFCRVYDGVQFCINQVFQKKCPNSHSFKRITQMLAEIKTEIGCDDFISSFRTSTIPPRKESNKQKKRKNSATTLKPQVPAVILVVLLLNSFL